MLSLPLAHGLLVSREDVPIPKVLFAWAVALVLIGSFVALTIAWTKPRFEDDGWEEFPGRARAMLGRIAGFAAGLLGVLLLALVVYAGLHGTEAPDRNFSVTFVFVTFWLGLLLLSLLFGDLFRAFNPWRAVARVAAGGFRLIAGQSPPPPLRYPERWGRWPAVLAIGAFAWLELIYALSGFQAVGLTPHSVAVATLIYTGWTFVGMALFGINVWLERGEGFSVYFNMISRIAPFEVRDGRPGRRPWLNATTSWATVPGSVALVLLVIGVTAFDGASESVLQEPIGSLAGVLEDIASPIAALRLSNTVFMALTVALVAGVYWAGIAGMHTVRTSIGTRELGRLFAHSFIPIAAAYLVAHYFTLFVFQEQAQFTYLLSDPLGDGSDLLGTAGSGIDYRLVGANLTWYVQVGVLAIGHVTALVLGHDRALKIYEDARTAARSQYWMLAMMVGFTTLGLFLLAQGNQ